MSTENKRAGATAGDRKLAFVRKRIDTDESERVQRTVLKELRELIAARLAAVEAERDALKIEYESRALRIDKMMTILRCRNDDGFHCVDVHEHAKALVSERNALRLTLANMREHLQDINEYWNGGNGSAPDACQHACEISEQALSLVPADLADCVCVKRSEETAWVSKLLDAGDANQTLRTANAALEAENRALREALTDSVEVLDRANHLYQSAINMRHVHDGKSDYLWSNLDNATGRYAAISHFSGNCNEEARIRKALAPKEGNAT